MISAEAFKEIFPKGESLIVEFKSDCKQISDSEIYENVVALANTEGGVMLIGVEDDGSVTGAKPRHGKSTDGLKLQSAIFNNTVPYMNTQISCFPFDDKEVIAIEVIAYPEACTTSTGKSLRRGGFITLR
jgi:ATP-dependent DNA helicase RecG